jgi:hypothetical protein
MKNEIGGEEEGRGHVTHCREIMVLVYLSDSHYPHGE